LAEEYRTVRLLCASIAGEAAVRGEHARQLGKQACDRINADFNIDDPSTPLERARSSLLPQRCCGPCLPPRRPRHGTCTARRRHSSNKRPSNQPKVRRLASASKEVRGKTRARGVRSPQFTRAVQQGAPPTWGARRPRSGSSTRAGKPRTATPTTSSMLGGRATRRHVQRRATTPDGADAMTARRIAHPRRNHWEHACSAGRSARRASPSASASPRQSSSTTGRRTPACGSTTTIWRVSWAGHQRRGYHP
jgi:hypothetical protein